MNGSGGKYRRREQARLDSQVANVSALTGRALQLAALGRPVDSLRAEREALAIRRELLPLIPAATGPIWPCA